MHELSIAESIVEPVTARVHCQDCGQESTPDFPFIGCMACGSGNVDILAGRDLTIRSVELKMPTD
jgi:Zn finger protein HypA/HybF involved in hydrogenase expression